MEGLHEVKRRARLGAQVRCRVPSGAQKLLGHADSGFVGPTAPTRIDGHKVYASGVKHDKVFVDFALEHAC